MAISNLTPVEPWPSRKLPQDRFDASVKTAMDQMSVMVGELNDSFIPAANETSEAINTLNPDLPAIRDAPNQAAAAAASAKAAANSANAAAESVSAAAQEVEKAKTEVVNAQAEADRAKAEADRAEAIAGVGPATAEKLGLVKPDGTTTQTTADGTLSVPTFEGSSAGLVPATTSADTKKVLLGNGTWGSAEDDAAAMTISEDLILTVDSPRTLVLTASASGLSVRLPDPATVVNGTTFHIIVRPLEDIQLCDFSGHPIKAYPLLHIFTAIRVQLVDASTGLWALAEYKSGSASDAQGKIGLNIGELTIFNSANTSNISVAALSESKAIVCYSDGGNSSYGTACVLTISGTTVSVGNKIAFNSAITPNISVAALSESKAIVCYSDGGNSSYGTACVLTISGTTVSVGNKIAFNSADTSNISVAALSENKSVVCYNNANPSPHTGETRILTISDTTVRIGEKTVFNYKDASQISMIALSESKAVVCYRDESSGHYCKANVLKISETTITAGNAVEFTISYARSISIAAISETKAIISCSGTISSNNVSVAFIINISGEEIKAGGMIEFEHYSVLAIGVAVFSSSKAIVTYDDTIFSNFYVARVLNIVEDNIIVGSKSVINSSGTVNATIVKKHLKLSNVLAVSASGSTGDNRGMAGVIYIS